VSDRDVVRWVDPLGNVTPLFGVAGDLTIYPQQGKTGTFMPPVDYAEDALPLEAGTTIRRLRVKPREVDIPLYVEAATSTLLRTGLRTLARAMNPAMGDGRLRVLTPDGAERELYCRYLTGLDGDESRELGGARWRRLVLTFRAHQPYWYARTPVVATYVQAAPTMLFFPILPLTLSAGTILVDPIVANAGDVDAWPQWLITGPASSVSLRNVTTGKGITLTNAIVAGTTVAIDTRPGTKTVRDGNGLAVPYTGSLWPLVPGDNQARFEATFVSGATSVRITYAAGYLSL
jgi:hypothetical protein